MIARMTRSFLQTLALLIPILLATCQHSAQGGTDAGYDEFLRLAQDGRKAEALELGRRLWGTLRAQKPDSAALVALTKRLETSQRLVALVENAVKPSQTTVIEGIVGLDDLELASPSPRAKTASAALPPSAQEFYWTHLSAFAGVPALDALPRRQATFLGQYYDLQMQDSILRIGRQVAITDPNAWENVCYALVLPLLYLQGRDDAWNQVEPLLALFSPRQLDVLGEFSLLQAERPQASLQIAQHQATRANKVFSLAVWASAAADTCAANHRPDLARQALQIAMDGAKDRNQAAELRLKIVEGYARCGDYATAAQMCRQMARDLPDAPTYGKTLALYFGYLAREGKADQVVAETGPALQDVRCRPYLPQILYLRWWALCKTNRQDEAVGLAQRLIEQYPRSPCVAPVLLERATDALARQQYTRCRELLTRLAQDFPGTESAKRAEEILVRLQRSEIQ